KIKSVIFAPAREYPLKNGFPQTGVAMLKAGQVVVGGVAWNDGTSLIDAVELSTDGGRTWRRAELERAGRYAWQHWQAPVDLPKGEHVVLSRAVDTLGNSQPLDGAIDWTPDGYCWRAADRLVVRVEA
ncbi:MAG TPA: hypothetical protein VNC50_17710, partial [Planctomycetia bacterium]|nr:hypothetical protein [Planctomycetia bacterium]